MGGLRAGLAHFGSGVLCISIPRCAAGSPLFLDGVLTDGLGQRPRRARGHGRDLRRARARLSRDPVPVSRRRVKKDRLRRRRPADEHAALAGAAPRRRPRDRGRAQEPARAAPAGPTNCRRRRSRGRLRPARQGAQRAAARSARVGAPPHGLVNAWIARGEEVYGEFLSALNVALRAGTSYRYVESAVVRPSEDLGSIAARAWRRGGGAAHARGDRPRPRAASPPKRPTCSRPTSTRRTPPSAVDLSCEDAQRHRAEVETIVEDSPTPAWAGGEPADAPMRPRCRLSACAPCCAVRAVRSLLRNPDDTALSRRDCGDSAGPQRRARLRALPPQRNGGPRPGRAAQPPGRALGPRAAARSRPRA